MKLELSSAAEKILHYLVAQNTALGHHLPAQRLADALGLSRTPINEALAQLAKLGLLKREANRGYFLAKPLAHCTRALLDFAPVASHSDDKVYFQIAEDLFNGTLPFTVSEVLLKDRYDLTSSQLQVLLNRIAQEGWITKKAGYGWQFSTMLTTPESLLQSYRLRLALEPAALLEPNYVISPETIAQCRAAELHLLNGGIETDTPAQLHERGVRFHEALVEASGNPFFIETIKRVNRVRRLISYRSMQDRKRYKLHCAQHLKILELLEKKQNNAAARLLHEHLSHTLNNLEKITRILR